MRKLGAELAERILSESIEQVADMDTCERLLATLLSRQSNLEAKLMRRRSSAAAAADTPSQQSGGRNNTSALAAAAADVCPLCAGSGRATQLIGSRLGRARLAAATAAAAATLVASSGASLVDECSSSTSVKQVSDAAETATPVGHEQQRLERLVEELRAERRKLEEQVGKLATVRTNGLQAAAAAPATTVAPPRPLRAAGGHALAASAPTHPAAASTLLSSSIQRMKRMDTLKRRKMKRCEQSIAAGARPQATAAAAAAGASALVDPIANPVVSFGGAESGPRGTRPLKAEPISEQPDEESASAQVAPPGGQSARAAAGPMQAYGRSIRASLASLLGAGSPTHARKACAAGVSMSAAGVERAKRFSLNPFASVSAAFAGSFGGGAEQAPPPPPPIPKSPQQVQQTALGAAQVQAQLERRRPSEQRSTCSCLRSSASDQSVKNGQQVSVE